MIEIQQITPVVNERSLHRVMCRYSLTNTSPTLPADLGANPYGTSLSEMLGLLGNAFSLSFSKSKVLLNQLLGVEISRGAIATIRMRSEGR